MSRKGFTLSEVLITLTIVGIGAAILTPVIINITPDANKIAFKKAYSTIEQTVSTLINDEDYYPSCRHILLTDTSGNKFTVPAGFFIPDSATMTQITNSTPNCTAGDVPPTTDRNKFSYLFGQQIKVSGPVTYTQSTDTNGAPTNVGNTTFTSLNGMIWTIVTKSVPQFDLSSGYESVRIVVDVNGAKGPNCSFLATTYNSKTWPACSSATVWPTNAKGKAPDVYDIGISYDGNLQVYPSDQAATALLTKPMKNTNGSSVN